MMVIFTSQSDKKALKTTRWILDAFANRIGNDTWQTVITEDGLRMVHNLLRRHATKSLSVSCRWIRSRTRSQLLWIVGDKTRFNEEGYVPVNSTQKDEMHNAWENNWQYLPEIKALTAVAALLHDWGKANDAFQKLLQGKKGSELYRHEWLSCKLLEGLVSLSDNSSNDAWLQQLQMGTFSEKKLIKWVSENVGKPFSIMPPLAALLCWLILSHHRLPKLDDENSKRYRCTEIVKISQLLTQISADWGYIKGGKAAIKFSHGLVISAAWQKKLKKWCGRLLEQKDIVHDLYRKNNVRLLLLYARVSLMLADYTVSSRDKDDSWQEKNLLYANIKKQQVKQYLDEHLVRVAEQAIAIAHRLPKFTEGMSKAEDMAKLRKKSPADYAWQDKAVSKIRDVRQQVKSERQQSGWFVINMAGTGCGKTFANAKIMQAISPDGKSLRYSLLLGLRSLTLQTGQEYRARIGMDASEMAVLVGSAAVRDLYTESESWEDNSDTACMNELLPGEVYANFPQEDKFLQVLFASSRAAAGKNRDLLYAPILVATIDHLMPAVESVRGGRHILPLLRMMSADIVIDEIDDFAGADLVAVARLVHAAGLLGKNVILSSATIPPDLAEGLFSAYVSGRAEYTVFFGCHNELHCVWTDEFQTKIHHLDDSEQDKRLAVYRKLHKDFSLRHRNKLDLQPVKRYGWIVDCKSLMDVSEGAQRLSGYFQSIQDSILQMHACYAVKDKRTGRNISLGVVRLAHITSCVQAAKYLLKSIWPDDCAPRIMVYHSRQTALLRSRQEKYLDKVLKRREEDATEVDFDDVVLRRHIDETDAQNVIFILVATPVEEVGRDHDFDWAVIEPSSYRSIIQLAGRIRRHRHAIDKGERGNIAIMQYNIEALMTKKKVVFAMPGFECRQYMLSSHDMNHLVDTKRLADGINASPRIVRPEKLQPHDKLVHLEHQVLSDFRDLTVHGAGYIHGWQEETWWLTALPQQFNKFREGKQEIELCLQDKEGEGLAFYEQSPQTKEWIKRETAYGIVHEQVAEKERFWLERNYQQALADYLEGEAGWAVNLRVGMITIPGRAEWRYADQFGMYKEIDDVVT